MLTKEEMPACPVATTVQLIGSKWKLLILRNLLARPWRFNELRKRPGGHQPKGAHRQPALHGGGRPGHPHSVSRSAAPGGILPEPAGGIHAAHHRKPWSSGVPNIKLPRPGNSRAFQQKRSRRLKTAGGSRFLHSILFTLFKGAGILNPPGKSPARIPSPPAQG